MSDYTNVFGTSQISSETEEQRNGRNKLTAVNHAYINSGYMSSDIGKGGCILKMIKWILIGAAVLAVIIVAVVLYPVVSAILRPEDNILDGGDMENKSYLKSVTYTEYGDMSGGSVYIKMYIDDVGDVWLDVSECASAGADEVTNTYQLDRNAVYAFNTLYDEKCMSRCADLPDSDLIILDAAVSAVNIELSDRTISFNSNNEFPEECIGAIGATHSLLASFIPAKE